MNLRFIIKKIDDLKNSKEYKIDPIKEIEYDLAIRHIQALESINNNLVSINNTLKGKKDE